MRASAALKVDQRVAALAWRTSLDAVAAELAEALEAAGVRPLLLKGPAIESWLYRPGERDYDDVDILIAPGDLGRAHGVLTGAGFFPVLSDDATPQDPVDPTAGVWDELNVHAISYRRTDGLPGWIDVHRTLWKTSAPAWEVLSARTDRLLVAGRELEVPALPGRALIVALHALHHVSGRDAAQAGKAVEDLRRAVAHADGAIWREASRMAANLRSELQLADALRLVAGGGQLAAALELPRGAGAVDAAHAERILYASRYEQLSRAEGWRARSRVVTAVLFPSRELIHAVEPRTRRSKVRLAIAYGAHLGIVARRMPSGLRRWRRARTALAATQRSAG